MPSFNFSAFTMLKLISYEESDLDNPADTQ